ncbi:MULTISPECIES: peptidase inhibitor family I36 protein [Streptomyces violaceusniger group]|uniref:Peptidase inhibitor family I36 n=2 Tax=Streptomyces rhizosphaericus TaxID=114699 RepID=A0ABP4D8R6_9ACTN|nr:MULTISPECIES: peptidase inhibitor family I36 protein [Streptomyces violaceusniger group]
MLIRSRLARFTATAAVAVGAMTASTAVPASAAPAAFPIDKSECPAQYFCAWHVQDNSYSEMCKWKDNAPSWYNCSWVADGKFTYAVYNNGTSGRGVTMYREANYHSAIGDCVSKGEFVRLANNYSPLSSKWNC